MFTFRKTLKELQNVCRYILLLLYRAPMTMYNVTIDRIFSNSIIWVYPIETEGD